LDRANDEELTQLLASARAGSSASFEAIYLALSPSVASYLRLNGAEDVEDLTNEVFAQVHRGLARFAGDWAGFRSFTFTIAHRRVIDDRRRRRRRPVTEGLVAEQADAVEVDVDVLGSMGVGTAMDLLRDLSPDQRDVLLLRVVSDLSIEDVAETLGKTPGAVKALQHRALASLRRAMEAQEVEP
jgi:RNA polymerase sigma-70 factor (ECF subfamily)